MSNNEKDCFIANPLGYDSKREKSGSETFRKYNYQYHWAFCRMLDEHESGNDYALFLEEHEDVVIADSLNGTAVLFEFNQIKETNKKHTIVSLSTIDKKEKYSLIGKLGNGVGKKSYGNKVKKVNFVSTGGYSFAIHKKGFLLEVLKCGDLSGEELDTIIECLGNEVGDEIFIDNFLNNLAFVIPNLPAKSFDDVVEGRISKLINKIAPGCKCNPGYIYDCVIRDLYRKGENTFDYRDWTESLRKKAITRDQFQNILDQHISRKPDGMLNSELLQILANEYSLKSLRRREIIKGFNRYYTKRISERSTIKSRI
jgi:hypothetical protein